METTLIDRIIKFMNYKGLTEYRFELLTKLANGSLGKARMGSGRLRSDNLVNILNAFPELDANWLLTGSTSMLKGDADERQVVSEPSLDYGNKYLMELVEVQRELINSKNKEIERLTAQVAEVEQSKEKK